jgi:hypothetical protein
LRDVVDGAKGMCLIMGGLCEIRGVAVVVKGNFVFIVMSGKSSSSLIYVGFVAIWAG